MSTIRKPVGPQSPKVYWRRRAVVLLGLIAVIAIILLIVLRPGSGDGAEGEAPKTPSAAPVDQSTIPTEPTAVDGDACKAKQVQVEAVTDDTEYAAGEQPQLSVTITNTGKNVCVLNAGTAAQVFTVTSGSETYWTSTDCQLDPVDAEVSLAPGKPISSSAPIVWDRTRSAPDSCDRKRDAAPADGASYHLTVTVDGVESAETKQFMLF
ncbi:hypothetical protein [Agromyces archimandritae]|uniref:DUF4232 domain-containing protein n=1 Tax=Agromyces archimandritae TaxID=2781962 RepID=A0A975FPY8_9MICO|nr:hypothetical protein [Agromyces archimandritae]QTX05548.1 hypothetical protein G127AT_04865 [Agromyces archimandritae]